jgi:hypothetical protein
MSKLLRYAMAILGLGLSLAVTAGVSSANGPCTIYCNNTSNLSCTSQVGDCQLIVGDFTNFLVCDGQVTACPH